MHAARRPLFVYDAYDSNTWRNGDYGTISSNEYGYRPWIYRFWHKSMLRRIGASLEGMVREGWRSKCDKKLSWAHPYHPMWPLHGRLILMHPTCQAVVLHPMLGWKMTSYIPWSRTYMPIRQSLIAEMIVLALRPQNRRRMFYFDMQGPHSMRDAHTLH